uniref:Carbohydrate sulfotransferase n=1 Tax=Saccoglossus kowalevskii TaxID=10224 RepID=A0ABM0GKD3_SACKO
VMFLSFLISNKFINITTGAKSNKMLPICFTATDKMFMQNYKSQGPPIFVINKSKGFKNNRMNSEIQRKSQDTIHQKSISDMNEIQRQRKHLIQQICAKMKWNTTYYHEPDKNRKIIIIDKYHFQYCRIPKIGNTSWKRIILTLLGVIDNTDSEISFRKIHCHEYPTISLMEPNKNYTSFLFVRHPFQRILSAYKDKILKSFEGDFQITRRQILSEYRQNVTDENSGADVSFPEFVKFLVNLKGNLNAHWDFQHTHCAVCELSYDFIGHFENLVEESNYLLHLLGINTIVFPKHEYSYHVTNSSEKDIYLNYFSQVSSEDILKLYEFYKMDFELFGYSFPQELF